MQYETKTNYRFNLSNNLSEQSLFKEQSSFVYFVNTNALSTAFQATGFHCASKLVPHCTENYNCIQKISFQYSFLEK